MPLRFVRLRSILDARPPVGAAVRLRQHPELTGVVVGDDAFEAARVRVPLGRQRRNHRLFFRAGGARPVSAKTPPPKAEPRWRIIRLTSTPAIQLATVTAPDKR